MNTIHRLLAACLLVLVLSACAAPLPAADPLPSSTFAAVSPTPTAIPTAVPTTALAPAPVAASSPAPSSTPTPPQPAPEPTSTSSPTQDPSPTPEPVIRFAVIGDFGLAGQAAADVAALVKSWDPDFIITTGDNNYPDGAWETIDENIGQYYHEFIHPYRGSYGSGAEENRFFPTLGNHDYVSDNARPYFEYFSLPGNERYYDFTWGPLHFFNVNSNYQEPDGVGRSSAQAAWLREGLAASTAPWKIVYTHLSPYSSGYHGGIDWIVWPFKEWGASAVLTGHDHTYERLEVDGLPYIVNGLGGGARYRFKEIHPGSLVRFNSDWGAQLVTATSTRLTFEFYTRKGELVDSFSLTAEQAYLEIPVLQ